MSYHFQTGSQVVCVDNSPPRLGWRGCIIPELGRIYTIRDVVEPGGWHQKSTGVRLEEILNPLNEASGNEYNYGPHRFRPVRTTNIEIFERLLAPSPKELEKCR